MIHLSLELRSGGTVKTTIDFESSGYKVLDGYYPRTSDQDKPVTDSFDLLLSGVAADLIDNLREIELALDFAGKHPSGPDGVWILFSPSEVIDQWQSRLVGGSVLLDEGLNLQWKNNRLRLRVVVQREPWWEETTATTLTISNSAGTDDHVDIYNHQDAGTGHDFYAQIGADQVEGGLPAPAIIEYKPTINDGVLVDHLYIGHFAASKPLTPPTAASMVFEGSGQSDGNCSGSAYDDLTWSDETETQLVTWAFDTEAFIQRNYKLLARLRDVVAYTDLFLKCKLLSGSTVLAETRWQQVTASKSLVVIGSLQIPPFKHGTYVDLGNLTLGLYSKRAGGAGAMNLDFVTALPLDGWRVFTKITGLAYNETLVDNPVDDVIYTAYGSAYKVTSLLEEGEPIMLMPGVINLLYFLADTSTGTAPIERTAEVTVKYHARRRTV
jgi:hypothetical protein